MENASSVEEEDIRRRTVLKEAQEAEGAEDRTVEVAAGAKTDREVEEERGGVRRDTAEAGLAAEAEIEEEAIQGIEITEEETEEAAEEEEDRLRQGKIVARTAEGAVIKARHLHLQEEGVRRLSNEIE
mmetsp:Transcript_41974/g.48682  ORF Transcript_41974/g.48682 Transcript_41974/m.48682 type:complete len:128 (+) Transcript_41974:416-799(+)